MSISITGNMHLGFSLLLLCILDFRCSVSILVLRAGNRFADEILNTVSQFYGIRHYIENFVSRKWTLADVEAAEAFYK